MSISCAGNFQKSKMGNGGQKDENIPPHTPCEIVDFFFQRYVQGSFFIDEIDSIKYMRNIHFQGDWGVLRRMKEDSGEEVSDIMIDYFFKEENLFVQVRFYEQDFDELFLVSEILREDSVYIVDYNKSEGCKIRLLPSEFKKYKISELEHQKQLVVGSISD